MLPFCGSFFMLILCISYCRSAFSNLLVGNTHFGYILVIFVTMNVFYDIEALPVFKNAVVTIGTFDGVHLGHRKIIEQLKTEAEERNGETVIITFYPHPRNFLQHHIAVPVITTLQEKIKLLENAGIDHLIVVDFNEKFAGQTAWEYVKDFLFEKIHPSCIIIGYDHRFGKGRQGNYLMLQEAGRELGFDVMEINAEVVHHVTVSSTKIRNAVLCGDIAIANELLGYPYFFEGKVVKGNQLGRTIGYPTANLSIENPEKLIPSNGVYAVRASVHSADGSMKFSSCTGMMNIGVRPTVDGINRIIEVNIFDFDENIYGSTVHVEVISFIRHEQKFSGLEALKEQLAADKQISQKIFNHRSAASS